MAIKNRSFPLLEFIMIALISWLIIGGNSDHISAVVNPNSQSTGIQAKIPSDPPTSPATIATPGNGQTFTEQPIKVSGLCTSGLLVKIFKNGVFAGSVECINGSYSINIDLFDGKNDLIARVYDALDQTGPDSAVTSITFTQGGFNTNAPRVSVTSDYAKRGANPNEVLTWPLLLSGGTAPFAVSIDWGDGSTQLVSRSFAGAFDVSHTYAKSGVYTVIVKVTDAAGQSSFLQLVGVANGAITQTSQNSGNTTTVKTVIIWWPLIIAVVMVFISFWLGGRFKLENLRRQAEKRISY